MTPRPGRRIRWAVEKAAADDRDVHTDYRRIVRELKTNRVRADMVDRVEKKICEPLDEALRGEFDRTAEALTRLGPASKRRRRRRRREGRYRGWRELDALVGRSTRRSPRTRELAQGRTG